MAGTIILEFIGEIIGVSFLWIKNKGKKSLSELKKEVEDQSFSIEGGKVILFIVGIIMLVAILTFLFGIIYRIIID